MSNQRWPFGDSPDVVAITSKNIALGSTWIAYVSHDLDDGAWQFHNNQANDQNLTDAVILSLKNIFEIDPTIGELANLPLGWHAWRKGIGLPWVRAKI